MAKENRGMGGGCLFFLGLFLSTAAVAAAEPPQGAIVDSLKGKQLELLENQFLIAVGISDDPVVGDLIDTVHHLRIANCFKDLAERRSSPRTIVIRKLRDDKLAAALGLGGVADAEISGGDVERFELILDDSILVDAGIEDFRQALRREVPECSSLQPILTAGFRDATADTDPAMFVAKVLLARRKLTIEIASRGSGGVEAESLLKRIGRWVFGATASVTAQTDRSTTIEVVSNAVLPVAYQPYYIPVRRTVGTTMGGGGTQSQTVVRLEAFRPELPSHAAAWEQWISELQ